MNKLKKIIALFLIVSFLPFSALAENAPTKNTLAKTTAKPLQQAYFDGLENDEFETYETKSSEEIFDPFEKINRKIFTFNDAFDRYFFEYVAKVYRVGVPKDARNSIRNFLLNLSLPVSALNSFAQGNVDNGLATLSNFLINSTIGLLGIFDVAGEKNIRYKPEDFGQTLAHYGTGSGAFLMLPFIGPSSTRDFGGWTFDKIISPTGFNIFEIGDGQKFMEADYRIGLTIVSGIDSRESLIDIIEDIRQDSFDPYATIRSAYLQKRISEIKN